MGGDWEGFNYKKVRSGGCFAAHLFCSFLAQGLGGWRAGGCLWAIEWVLHRICT